MNNPAEKIAPVAGSYLAQIVQVLNQFGSKILPVPTNPRDKNANVGVLLGEAYLWDEVERYAAAQSKKLWVDLEKDGVVKLEEEPDPGDHVLAESLRFVCAAKVTQPVRRFNGDELAKLLKKSHNVPLPVTKEMIEKAKKPTKSIVQYKITERV